MHYSIQNEDNLKGRYAMKTRKWIMAAALAALPLAGAIPVNAQQAPALDSSSTAQHMQTVKDARTQQTEQARRMLGEIEAAALLLILGLNDDAREHLMTAQETARELEANAPSIIMSDTVKIGNTSYTHNGVVRNYMVPVIDDVIAVQRYNVIGKHMRDRKIDVTDDRLVYYRMEMNVANVRTALTEAEAMIEKGDNKGAIEAMKHITKNALVEEVTYQDPTWRIHDNLALAHNEMHNNNYKQARFALKHAERELDALAKSKKSESYRSDVTAMQQEVATLHDELKMDDPNILQRAEQRIGGWMREVKSWTHKGNQKG